MASHELNFLGLAELKTIIRAYLHGFHDSKKVMMHDRPKRSEFRRTQIVAMLRNSENFGLEDWIVYTDSKELVEKLIEEVFAEEWGV